MAKTLRDAQLKMARYLRDPDRESPPERIEPRRLKIYEELVYNNIESFLTSGFPIVYSLYEPDDWRDLVRRFMQEHRCHSPYFLEISQEFLQFLLEGHSMRPCDPPFLQELAHYEWVELALDVSTEVLPPANFPESVADCVPRLSPLAWPLAYQYPVHRIGSRADAGEPSAPTYLVVYRNRDDLVKFMEVNAPTARLLELVRANEPQDECAPDSVESARGHTAAELLDRLAEELGMDALAVHQFGLDQFRQLLDDGIIWIAP